MALRMKKIIGIKGMTCTQCEKAIHRALTALRGVTEASVSFRNSSATVIFDSMTTNEVEVHQAIRDAGYEVVSLSTSVKKTPGALSPLQMAGVGILLVAVYLLVERTVGFNFIPKVNASMGYGMLFVVGLLTSLHCIAMCGGINLSQCLIQKPDGTSQAGWKPSLLYNGGRVISYTIVGGVVGALGSVIRFPGPARGIIAILAGLFMVVMGINMLGFVPALRRFQIHIPAGIRNKLLGKSGDRGPFVVGLLNGLMPCGPLQAMQLYALGSGSAFTGAISMFLFSLGTVPLMFGFGVVSTMLSKKFTRAILRFSAVLVVVLGVIMMQRGFSLGGINIGLTNNMAIPTATATATVNADATKEKNNVQVVKGEVRPNTYPAITVNKGVPVQFNLHADAANLNGCNGFILIPEFNIQKELQPGDNIIEFTPQKTGQIVYTCWMGMISSTITVEE